MPYSTYADLIAALEEPTVVQLSDDNGDGVADTAVIDKAIADADSEINSLVGIRYALPLNPVPSLATILSARMAIYHLFNHRGGGVPDAVIARYKAAVASLQAIRDGNALWGEAVDLAPDQTEIDVRVQSSTRVFSRDNMKGF